MPAFYTITPGATITTSGTPNTPVDHLFLAPGTNRRVALTGFYINGRSAGVSQLSGLNARLEKWTSSASSGGTGCNPVAKGPEFRAAQATAGFGSLVSGTGGPSLLGSVGFGITGPGQWVARNLDEALSLDAAATQSIDVFDVSGTASLPYECWGECQEQ